MVELVVWLRAQLDEDERIARAAGASVGPVRGALNWRLAEGGSDEGGRYWQITTLAPDDTVPTVELVGNGMSGGGVHEEALGRHMVEHDPARVLREIDAKRRTLVRCEEAMLSASPMLVHFAKQTVWEMAQPYRDRPGLKEEWRP